VDINVEYVTSSGPSTTRTLALTQVVAMSLPVAVNVEDFFRGTRYSCGRALEESIVAHNICRLFSRFTVSTTSHRHVRIASAELDGPDTSLHGVKIAGCLSSNRGIVASLYNFSHQHNTDLCQRRSPPRNQLTSCFPLIQPRDQVRL
jgi:trafficking protein particle complex subunit 10